MHTETNVPRLSRKAVLALLAALCLAFTLALAACQPSQSVAPDTSGDATIESAEGTGEGAAEDGADAVDESGSMTVISDFQNPNAGDFADSYFVTNFVNDQNRGCSACHADLWDVMNDLSPIQHVLTSPAGYGQTYGITDCMTCHNYNLPDGGPKFSDLIHTAHYTKAEFTDEDNGTCWSCHATNNEGDLVLYDLYKYTSEFGGYPNMENPEMQDWLSKRQWENGTMTGVVIEDAPAIDVELSQPVSDEEDMYVADNYVVPELDGETWELKVTGVVNERTFTLDDLKALPQTEYTVTQDCLTNGINGVMIGNIPVKGVLVSDLIEACGGVAEGNTAMQGVGADTWSHNNTVEYLLEQNAMIALEYWGHELTVDQGYPATLVVPGNGGAMWDKWLIELRFNNDEGAFSGTWVLKAAFTDAFQGVQCAGWFSPDKDGKEFKVGEAVAIDGYAYLDANNGHRITQVAFSADYGANWTTFDVPDSFDPKQWVRWEGTWTPETAGTYVLHVKAIDELGDEQYLPASVIVKVTE